MVTNRIKMGKRSKVEIPLFHEIIEGKVKLTLQVYEDNNLSMSFSEKDLRDWLLEEKQQYPMEQQRYTLYHKSEKVYFVCNEDIKAELVYEIEWEDALISVSGAFGGQFATRETSPEPIATGTSEKEDILKQELREEQRKNDVFQNIMVNYMLQSFHENGTYVQKLNEIEKSLKESEGKAAFQEWKRRSEELEVKKQKKQDELKRLQDECRKKEKDMEKFKEDCKEEQKKREQLDKLNEETLKKLQENRERLRQDQEVLEFIENNNLDVEKELKSVEDTLKRTEEMVRKAIVLKEKKIDTIEKLVRGDGGSEE